MKNGFPYPGNAEIPAENREHTKRADSFYHQRGTDHKACQPHNAADFWSRYASCIRPRWDREMRRPDKSEKDAPTVITPKPPIWISTINTA